MLNSLYTTLTFIGSCLLMAAFFVSPALMSIAMGVLLLVGLFHINKWKKWSSQFPIFKSLVWVMTVFLIAHITSAFLSDNQSEAMRKLSLKLPFFLSPFLLYPLSLLNKKQLIQTFMVFLYFVYFTGTVSVVIYFRNQHYFDELILQAKPIPIFFGYGIYHIQFSILNATASLAGIYIVLFHKKNIPFNYYTAILLLSLGALINLHILSARTGLMSFYLGLMCIGGYELLRMGKLKRLLPFMVFMIALPIISYFSSDALKNRITNTKEDIHTILNNENPNDKSIAMRIEAWKTGWGIITAHPWFGVGLGDLEEEMQAAYIANQTLLTEYNRKNPHNQFIETGVHIGIGGIILLGLFFGMGLWKSRKMPLVLGFVICWLSSFFFESMLERQVSIFAFSFLFLFFFTLETQLQTNLAHKLEQDPTNPNTI